MSLIDWAKKEVDLACANERKLNATPDGEWDYGCACYESALKAFDALMGAGHSGYSIKLTKTILNRLIDGQPLMPIEDVPEVWNLINEGKNEKISLYQCKRMSSLFKHVYTDGSVTYNDVGRCYAVNVNKEDDTFQDGLTSQIVDEMMPITIPYSPLARPIVIYCADSKYDLNGEPVYLREITHLIIQSQNFERIEIDRFFTSRKSFSDGDWVEIPKQGFADIFKFWSEWV